MPSEDAGRSLSPPSVAPGTRAGVSGGRRRFSARVCVGGGLATSAGATRRQAVSRVGDAPAARAAYLGLRSRVEGSSVRLSRVGDANRRDPNSPGDAIVCVEALAKRTNPTRQWRFGFETRERRCHRGGRLRGGGIIGPVPRRPTNGTAKHVPWPGRWHWGCDPRGPRADTCGTLPR
eukprot:scaffold649_cov347-Pavlova_lutheri.AAC.6